MSENSNSFLKDYEIIKKNIFEKYSCLSAHPNFTGFWLRWTSLHSNLLVLLESDKESSLENQNYQEDINLFLKQRERMVSALRQGLQALVKNKEFYFGQLSQVLKEHDGSFDLLIKSILENLSCKIIHVQKAYKVTQAYRNIQYAPGGR